MGLNGVAERLQGHVMAPIKSHSREIELAAFACKAIALTVQLELFSVASAS
jgi:hypothetical protein